MVTQLQMLLERLPTLTVIILFTHLNMKIFRHSYNLSPPPPLPLPLPLSLSLSLPLPPFLMINSTSP